MDGNHGELYPRSHEFVSYGIPYIGANDFWGGQVSFKNCKFLSEERARKFKKGIARSGDVLFAHNATVGPVALLDFDEDFLILSTTATYFRCNPEKLNNLYFRFVIEAQYFIKQYRAVMAQSTRFQVPITTQRKLLIAVPPLPEQRSIAQALSDVDRLIAALEKAIAKKRHLKTATMQQLLTGKKRLPGFGAGKGYQKTEIGTIPEDWNVKHLKDALKTNPRYGINAAAVPYRDSLPIYIRITDISEAGYFAPESLVSVNQENSDQYYLEEGDLVFARTGASVGKSYLYNPNDGKLVFAGFLIRIRPNENILLPDYLSQYVRTKAYWDWVQLMSMRSGQPGINGNEYGQLLVPLPDMREQCAIATVLSDMDAEIAALETRLAKTQSIKQGMMQQLLTGKVRLKIEVSMNAGREDD